MNESATRTTSLAFLGIVLFGGLNGLAVKYTLLDLDPFWGAAIRFLLAAALLGLIVAARRLALPRGRMLLGSVLYGVLAVGGFYALMYYGLVEAPAGLTMVVLALVPLLTLLLAVVHGLEKLHRRGLAGALLALVGVLLIFSERLGGGALSVPPLSLLAVALAAVVVAEGGVAVKYFPRAHPVVNNSIAMAIGGLILLVLALFAGERLVVPTSTTTLAATAYLVLLGSIGLFMLFLYVIERWTASATSYSLLLMPLVTIVGSTILLGEPLTVGLFGGGLLIFAGVYIGVFAPAALLRLPSVLRRAPMPATASAEVAERPGPICP